MGDLSTIHCTTEPNGRSFQYPLIGDLSTTYVQKIVMGDLSNIHLTTEPKGDLSTIHFTTEPNGRSL